MRRFPSPVSVVASVALIGALTACGGPPASSSPTGAPATEFNPPGDIPDDQAFVDFKIPGSAFVVQVPEGWAQKSTGGVTTFTDHYNSVSVEVQARPLAPTVESARSDELPTLARHVTHYSAGDVVAVTRAHGEAVLITYQQDSRADPTTGKVVRDAVERYEFWSHGQEAIVTLSGPTGADNVDPWRIISDSVRWA